MKICIDNRRALAIQGYAEAKVAVARYLETGDLADLFPERNSPAEQGPAASVPQNAPVTKPTTPPWCLYTAANMSARALSEIRPVPRRGLSRDEAAMYIGVSAGKFDQLVTDGRMPAPVKIDGRKLWDIRSLDLAFDALPRENAANSWDGVWGARPW
jgi:predicted DNA-binding protein (UPF0251 family)